MLKPELLLHFEDVAVMLATCIFYQQSHGRWLWFGLLLLTGPFDAGLPRQQRSSAQTRPNPEPANILLPSNP
jgi:hypothetical protein